MHDSPAERLDYLERSLRDATAALRAEQSIVERQRQEIAELTTALEQEAERSRGKDREIERLTGKLARAARVLESIGTIAERILAEPPDLDTAALIEISTLAGAALEA